MKELYDCGRQWGMANLHHSQPHAQGPLHVHVLKLNDSESDSDPDDSSEKESDYDPDIDDL